MQKLSPAQCRVGKSTSETVGVFAIRVAQTTNMAAGSHVNVNNPAVKRLLSEAREIAEAGPSPDFHAEPLEDDLFEWHFTIRGPPGTAFEGGRYHGRIMLPPEYPFKPPSITLLNASGRFEIGKKICARPCRPQPLRPRKRPHTAPAVQRAMSMSMSMRTHGGTAGDRHPHPHP